MYIMHLSLWILITQLNYFIAQGDITASQILIIIKISKIQFRFVIELHIHEYVSHNYQIVILW